MSERTVKVNGKTVEITKLVRGVAKTVSELRVDREAYLDRFTAEAEAEGAALMTAEAAARAGRRAARKAVKAHLGTMSADALLARILGSGSDIPVGN